jgi:hypothetical protein
MSKAARTQAIKEALVSLQRESILQCTYQIVVYSLFLLRPWFYNKHAYLFPVSSIAYAVLGKKVAFTTVDVEHGSGASTSTSHASKDETGGSKDDGSSLSSSKAAVGSFISKAAVGSFLGTSHEPPHGLKNAKVEKAISSFVEADRSSHGDEDGYV